MEYGRYVVFIHVVSAVIWVGGMIAIRVAVHPSMLHIEDGKLRMARQLEIMARLFRLVAPFVVLLLLTAVVMEVGLGLKADPEAKVLATLKEGLWIVMTLNYLMMIYRRGKAQRLFLSGDQSGAGAILRLIPHFMLPVNIAFGLIAVYFGVVLRGF